MVDGGHAEFHGFHVLVGQIHALEDVLEHRRLTHGLATAAVGEALARLIGLRQFILVRPATGVDQLIDIGAVGAVRVGEHPQRRRLQIAALLRLMVQRMLAHEVHLDRLVRAGGKERGFSQHLVCSAKRSRKMPERVISTSTRGRPNSSSGIRAAPHSRP